jgi:hypothetical protein
VLVEVVRCDLRKAELCVALRDSRKLNCSREESVKNSTPPYTLNEREHLRLVTRLRIWGRSSESFARKWDRGGRARLVTRAFDTWPGACRLLA